MDSKKSKRRNTIEWWLPGAQGWEIWKRLIKGYKLLIIRWVCSGNLTHSKVMHKILQARLHQYINQELPDVQAGFQRGRETRDQIANICWIMEKAWEFQKNIYFCFIDYAKASDCVDNNKLWKILKEMGISDHLTCLLRGKVSLETCMCFKMQQLELDMKQLVQNWERSITIL